MRRSCIKKKRLPQVPQQDQTTGSVLVFSPAGLPGGPGRNPDQKPMPTSSKTPNNPDSKTNKTLDWQARPCIFQNPGSPGLSTNKYMHRTTPALSPLGRSRRARAGRGRGAIGSNHVGGEAEGEMVRRLGLVQGMSSVFNAFSGELINECESSQEQRSGDKKIPANVVNRTLLVVRAQIASGLC